MTLPNDSCLVPQQVLEQELQGATVLQVAHNLSSVKGYDRILGGFFNACCLEELAATVP